MSGYSRKKREPFFRTGSKVVISTGAKRSCHAALKSRKMHYEAKILHSNRGIKGAFVLLILFSGFHSAFPFGLLGREHS